ncbi:hypothetical protein P8452_46247 [Trifolium repens]|nr:hypothetical protein P8452_46247 [Trifolium repens]
MKKILQLMDGRCSSDSIDGARSTLTGESSTAAPATTSPSIIFSVPPPSRVCCSGRGKNGSLCVLRQSIRLEVIFEGGVKFLKLQMKLS